MSIRPQSSSGEVELLAKRLLERIRAELLEVGPDFGIESNLFEAGLDSMGIMQVILMVEQEFATKLPDRLVKQATFCTARQVAEAVSACGRSSQ